LAYCLEKNHSLVSIHLCDNKITNVGASALAASLIKNKTLSLIKLAGNNISPKLMTSIEQTVARNVKIETSESKFYPSPTQLSSVWSPVKGDSETWGRPPRAPPLQIPNGAYTSEWLLRPLSSDAEPFQAQPPSTPVTPLTPALLSIVPSDDGIPDDDFKSVQLKYKRLLVENEAMKQLIKVLIG
jgi:hypothetical protein